MNRRGAEDAEGREEEENQRGDGGGFDVGTNLSEENPI